MNYELAWVVVFMICTSFFCVLAWCVTFVSISADTSSVCPWIFCAFAFVFFVVSFLVRLHAFVFCITD